MQIDIAEELETIWLSLVSLRRPVASRRRNGLPPNIFKQMLHSVDLAAPEELLRLYSICDGTETSARDLIGDITFFPGFYWLKCSDAVEVYKSLLRGDGWRSGWLPIFANGGGDFYAVVCDGAARECGSVIGFVTGEDEQIVEFQSVFKMFKTISLSYEKCVFYVNDDNLEADYPRMREIAKDVQPDFTEYVV